MRIVGFTLAAAFISVAFISTALAEAVPSKKVEQITTVWDTTLTRECWFALPGAPRTRWTPFHLTT